VESSRETVLLSDPAVPSHLSAFSGDPYFRATAARCACPPRALLCIPVLQAGAVYGVLYLENDMISSAFTSSHIELLQLLCGQAVLSLDNARLYAQLSQHNAQLEAQVQQRTQQLESAMQQAERATKIKSEFLANMSHEIRTPMNAVLGLSRLLSTTALSLEQQQYVSMIANSGQLLLTIINDILDYSSHTAPKQRMANSCTCFHEADL